MPASLAPRGVRDVPPDARILTPKREEPSWPPADAPGGSLSPREPPPKERTFGKAKATGAKAKEKKAAAAAANAQKVQRQAEQKQAEQKQAEPSGSGHGKEEQRSPLRRTASLTPSSGRASPEQLSRLKSVASASMDSASRIADLYDEISLSVISFLEEHAGISDVQYFERPPCAAPDIEGWERVRRPPPPAPPALARLTRGRGAGALPLRAAGGLQVLPAAERRAAAQVVHPSGRCGALLPLRA